jgi:hypothetical protein
MCLNFSAFRRIVSVYSYVYLYVFIYIYYIYLYFIYIYIIYIFFQLNNLHRVECDCKNAENDEVVGILRESLVILF